MTDRQINALASEIVTRASAHGVFVTTAESCTGGMVGAAITAIPGSSKVYERGFITYSNQAKIDLLGVASQTLDAHGAVSEQVAAEMALGALANSAAQYAVSITGIAGPGGSEYKPEGRVCFALATGEGARSETLDFGPLGRDRVRQAATLHALHLLHTVLQD